MSLALSAYRLATGLAEPLARPLLERRAAKGKEDRRRLDERLGRATSPRPDRPLVWLHGVSVGESVSLLPLVEALSDARPDLALLVTSGTVTAAEMMAARLPPGVLHQYVPVDGPRAVGRFLDHWRPSLAIFAEKELWPNLILQARARGVRLALISASFREDSAQSWARFPKAIARLLSSFDLILAQDADSAARLERLGARSVGLGNLKLAAPPLPVDEASLDEMRRALAGRRVVLGGSTHPGEEVLIARACPSGALLILAPRHPARGPEIAAQFGSPPLRSRGDAIDPRGGLYIADTMGELGLFFRLADLVVLGGSFLPGPGGHNPLEPARLGKAPLHGPHLDNWTAVYAALGESAPLCADEAQLMASLARLLADPSEAVRLGALAQTAAQAEDAAIDRILLSLSPLLPA